MVWSIRTDGRYMAGLTEDLQHSDCRCIIQEHVQHLKSIVSSLTL